MRAMRSAKIQAIPAPERLEVLDSLRGIAALGVVTLHAYWNHPLFHIQLVRNAYLFVDLFFVLSGFVITNAYQSRLNDWGQCADFLHRRWCRLFPVHIVLHAVWVAVFILYFGFPGGTNAYPPGQWTELLLPITMLHGVHPSGGVVMNGPSWSISVEFLAYAGFAAAGFAVRSLRTRVFLFSGVAVTSFAFLWAKFGHLDVLFGYGLARCVAGFSMGLLICYGLGPIRRTYDRLGARPIGIAQGATMVAIAVALNTIPGRSRLDFVLPPLFAILIATTVAGRTFVTRALSIKLLRLLGEVSYSLYMLHFLLAVLLGKVLAKAPGGSIVAFGKENVVTVGPGYAAAALVLYLALAGAGAWVSYELLEKRGRIWLSNKVRFPKAVRHLPISARVPADGSMGLQDAQ